MAMRRPRIKAMANLVNVKRKVKPPTITNESEQSTEIIVKVNELELNENPITIDVIKSDCAEISQDNVNETNSTELITISDDSAFKEPPKIDFQSDNNTNRNDDELPNDLEDNVLHMDLQKSSNGFPMSPSKQVRARMRPSPFMAQRRNSYVSSSPSPHTNEDTYNEFIMPSPRRERYHSTSLASAAICGGASPANTTNKYSMLNMSGRVRTESTCSSFSDLVSVIPTSINSNVASTKTRRQQNTDHMMRLQWRRDYESRCANGVPDKTRLKMLDLLFYNPTTNPMQVKLDANQNAIKCDKLIDEQLNRELEKKSMQVNNVANPVPQLKLNANNELVLDDKSLIIETTAEQEARKMLSNTSLLFVDENTGMNGFYSKQKRTREWPHDETIKFYRCLQTIGTDFSLMQQLFTKRTRRELKLKFKKEERVNGALINKALLHPKAFNVAELKEQLEREELKREEEQQKWQDIQQKQAIKFKNV